MDMSKMSYKQYHENYLSNLHGTSMLDISLLLTTAAFAGFNVLYLRCHIINRSSTFWFLTEFFSFVLPCILLITSLNVYTPYAFGLCIPGAFVLIVYELFIRVSKTPISKLFSDKIYVRRRPFVTHFKSVISLITIICILGVDFTVFPLKYAKTESYGYSLMDTGVGFFMFSNGMTVNVKNEGNIIKKSLVSNLPILALGLIRYATVEKIEYQHHVTEYGVHWNFFFTLAFVKFIGSFVLQQWPKKPGVLSLVILVLHELLLFGGLETWVIGNSPRTNIISANREGIVSLSGYLSLYLAGNSLGNALLPPSRVPTAKEEIHKVTYLFSASAVLFLFTSILDDWIPSSRRLSNFTFVSWMVALCLLVISFALMLEIMLVMIYLRRNVRSCGDKSSFILESISANNLLFFLMCNLLTGVINISMQTLFAPAWLSLLVITVYVFVACGIISILYSKKVTIKCW